MTDPDLDPLDPALRAFIELDVRHENVPTARRKELRSRLAPLFVTAVAAAPLAAALAPHAGGAIKSAIKWALRLKFGAALAVSAAVGATAHGVLSPKPKPEIVYVDREVRVLVPGKLNHDPELVPSAPAESASAIAPPPRVLPRPSIVHDTDLAGERVLIEMAHAALARKDGQAALDAASRYVAAYPRGQLGEEAEAIAIQALVTMGRNGEARARADRFRKRYPDGLFRAVVDKALEQAPEP